MRNRVIALLACVAVVAAAVLGQLALGRVEGERRGSDRYIQHERATQLSDLSAEDQAAASSLSTDPQTFASHLPVVSIDTGGQEIPGAPIEGTASSEEGSEVYLDGDAPDVRRTPAEHTLAADGRETISAGFSLYATDGSANRLTDEPAITTRAEIRYRGNSSRHFDKKGYRVKFTLEDRETSNDLDVLGMGAESSWVLHGPFLDKTLIRNYLGMNVAGQIMDYAPDVRFCELFVNGEYQGLYLLMESVEEGPDRLPLTESDRGSAATSYIVRRDWYDPTSSGSMDDLLYDIAVSRYAPIEIVYPGTRTITDDQRAWIASDLNYIEKCLYSYDYDTEPYSYEEHLDVDTFVDYAIINEFSANLDAGSYSTYFYRDVRGLLCAGPVWDFNNAFDNYSDESQLGLGFFMPGQPVYFMLFKDEAFVERTIERYRELREGVLSDEYLTSFVDETVAYLGPAVDRNYAVWGYSFDAGSMDADNRLNPVERNPASFEEAVDNIKTFITGRGGWLDRNIENLRQYSHESANKRYNH